MSMCAIFKTSPQIAQHQRLFNIFVIILVIFGVFHPREQARSPGLHQQGYGICTASRAFPTLVGAIRLLLPHVQPSYEQSVFNFDWCPVLPGVILS